jgi:hypothetical protein
MYIRFKVRARKRTGKRAQYSYHIVLVESHRVSGKPRQKILAYLGSIRREDFISPATRYVFLNHLRTKLDALDLDYWTIWQLKLKMIRAFSKKAVADINPKVRRVRSS